MIIYHGSDVVVERSLLKPKRTLDFGPGFYTSTNKEQAVSFAQKVMIRNDNHTKAVSMYEIDLEEIEHRLSVLKFKMKNG